MIDYATKSFWKENPELCIAPTIGDLYKKDKSKNKQQSSLLMWAIYLCESLDSKFYNHPDKYSIVAEKVLKDTSFNWVKQEALLDSFKDVVLSEAERALTIWNETMKLRNSSLKQMYQDAFTHKDTDELVKLDKMLSNTPKLFEDYKKIKQDYEEEKVQKKGNKIKSLSDSDEI